MLDEKFVENAIKEISMIDDIASLVYTNRQNILSIYIDTQFEIFDVSTEIIEEFTNELKDELKEMIKSAKKLKQIVARNTFNYKDEQLKEYKSYTEREEYQKISKILFDKAIEIGTDYHLEVTEEITRINNKKLRNEDYHKEYFEFLIKTQDFFSDLIDEVVQFAAQLHILMEEFVVTDEDENLTEEELDLISLREL